jgi:hypothetical protein
MANPVNTSTALPHRALPHHFYEAIGAIRHRYIDPPLLFHHTFLYGNLLCCINRSTKPSKATFSNSTTSRTFADN